LRNGNLDRHYRGRNHQQKAGPDQDRVDDQIYNVVQPVLSKNSLVWLLRQEPFEGNKYNDEHQDCSNVNPIGHDSSPGRASKELKHYLASATAPK
jgi:hypothetical protein